MRRTKIVPNGEPGVSEIQRSPLEVGLAVALFGAVLGVGAWQLLNQYQLAREVTEIKGDVQSIHTEISIRVAQRDAEHAQLVKSDDYIGDRFDAIVMSLASIELRLAAARSTSEANQQQTLGALEGLQVPKAKTK